MILLIAQTTQGMKSWGVTEWTIFYGLVTALVGTLTTSIIAIIKASRAGTVAGNAQETANTGTQNTQTLAAGQAVLAGKMRESPAVLNPPPSVEHSSLQIAADPYNPTPLPEGLAIVVQRQQEGTDT